jgi:hypothetical protein
MDALRSAVPRVRVWLARELALSRLINLSKFLAAADIVHPSPRVVQRSSQTAMLSTHSNHAVGLENCSYLRDELP